MFTLRDNNEPASRASQRKRKKEEEDFEREREKNRGTSIKTRVAIDTAAELKRKVGGGKICI